MASHTGVGQRPADAPADTAAPRWFSDALANPPAHGEVEVDGRRVHLRLWGQVGNPGVVLVHGGAAHSGWWDHIAPFLAEKHRVVALDLSGHGDSEWRTEYDSDTWAREVLAAAKAAGAAGLPFVVGHSMGGWVATAVGARYPDDVRGVVIIDSPLNPRPPEEEALRRRTRKTKIYASRDEIAGRFNTLPPQDVVLPYVRDHIIGESIRQVEGGWTWKFDPIQYVELGLLRDLLPALRCPTAYFRTEFGIVPPEMAAEIDSLLGYAVPIVELPASGHHPMLDQPLSLITALRIVIAEWSRKQEQAG